MLTDNDRSSICYFIKEKGDITRWVDWEEKKGEIAKEYPELMVALTNLNFAEIVLDAIVERIGDEIDY